jgi:hypothetical protein
MIRSVATLAIALGFLSAAYANITVAPLTMGADKKAAPSGPAESRQQIIDRVKADLEKVQDRLSAADAGAETRAGQDRILKGLDDLLKQKDPNPSKSPPPPSSSSPPKGSSDPMPAGNPMPTPASTKQTPAEAQPKPADSPMPTPAPAKQPLAEGQPKPSGGAKAALPNTPDAVRKESTIDGPWHPMPPRHRIVMDSVGRDRFVPNYQEILREYYRNLAQDNRGNND